MQSPAQSDSAAQRSDSSKWCWECQRRRLVCDCALPICNKCKAAGVVCPGYEDKKPLTWLAPGRVLSRTRKPRSKPLAKKKTVIRQRKLEDTLQSRELKEMVQIAKVKTSPEATGHPGSPCAVLEQPRPIGWDLVEAAMYYNTAVYPDLLAHQLAPNPFVVPVLYLYALPPAMQHALVSMALTHRIYRSSGSVAVSYSLTVPTTTEEQKTWLTRLHHHRGAAIRLMNEDIGREETRASDETITTVLVFLIGELQQSISTAWRHHVNGIIALLKLRGCFTQLMKSAEHLKPSLLTLMLVIVTANTTSPAHDQVQLSAAKEICELIPTLYGLGIYPPIPCSRHLFRDMVNINDLRARAADPFATAEDISAYTAEAQSILSHIAAFSPEEWADANPPETRSSWLLLAHIFHLAVSLYCVSSLQSVGLLPCSPELDAQKASHRDRLMVFLAEGLEAPLLKKSLLWPLVVAGFEVQSEFERRFVAKQLEAQSRELASSQPLVARAALQKFWVSGGTTWDECFDRPYAFLV